MEIQVGLMINLKGSISFKELNEMPLDDFFKLNEMTTKYYAKAKREAEKGNK